MPKTSFAKIVNETLSALNVPNAQRDKYRKFTAKLLKTAAKIVANSKPEPAPDSDELPPAALVVPHLGAFEVLLKFERPGVNPRTGQTVTIPARRLVRFRLDKVLTERVRRAEEKVLPGFSNK